MQFVMSTGVARVSLPSGCIAQYRHAALLAIVSAWISNFSSRFGVEGGELTASEWALKEDGGAAKFRGL